MERFSAELFDGQTAAVRLVMVGADIGGLMLWDASSDARLGLWSWSGLRAEALANGALHLEQASAPGAILTSREPGLRAALERAGVSLGAAPRGRRLVQKVLIYGAALAVVVTGIYLSLPRLSQLLARRVPLDVEEQVGLQIEQFISKSYCRDPAATSALEKLGRRLARAQGDGPDARRLNVINWKMVNAFTLPGGSVIVTRGLIDEAEGPDELAGVLAHELEHVRQRHVMAHIIRGSILSLGWAVTVGDFSGLIMVDPSTAFAIANQRFSRADERSADQGALSRLDAAGISREGFAAFFRRIQKDTDVMPVWLSTHPASAERIAAIAAGARKGGSFTPALTAEEWKALEHACAAAPPPAR